MDVLIICAYKGNTEGFPPFLAYTEFTKQRAMK